MPGTKNKCIFHCLIQKSLLPDIFKKKVFRRYQRYSYGSLKNEQEKKLKRFICYLLRPWPEIISLELAKHELVNNKNKTLIKMVIQILATRNQINSQ